ncbi:DGQHR domain-containing protein [Vibrio cholerae]|uniref:DGQHR domain-containing protein n=1 Tax=Vibrio cholerae TaxID=666 RepID=UPI000D336611|nr:DGQHR domain-containing protein [Vibrio cholerae]EGR0477769.1 DGQHR domain-containing protein [Vibrio cholerae]EGR0510561.1 DGQHR domain-containing protein [Vibrio cholerae]GHZ98221.1 tgtA5 cluster protein 1 [Vibrio cholerae]
MITEHFTLVAQPHHQFMLTTMTAGTLSKITYTAVRGVDSEVGAVQRVLIERRIKSLKDFILSGGDLPGCIILNWISDGLSISDNTMSFEMNPRLAQIIDGQHRVAGIKEAIKENPSISDMRIPVVVYQRLTTQECADIFIAINTEQKPAPKSLVYDLYGIGSEVAIDHAAARARDIAEILNGDQESPYYGKIKFPGEKRRKGGIALSTAVSAIKPLVEPNASFEQIGVHELNTQIKCLNNYFIAIANEYGAEWDLNTNAFQYSAGFTAACEFFKLKLLAYCKNKGSFKVDTIQNALKLNDNGLIRQEEVSGQGGKEATRIIYNRIDNAFSPEGENLDTLMF